MTPEFPPDWRRLKLADAATAIRDGTHGTHPRLADGLPLLSAKNVTNGGTVIWDESDSRISRAEYNGIQRTFELQRNDLLLTIVGSLGRRALHDGSPVAFQRSVAFIRPDTEAATARFLFHAVGHEDYQRQLVQRSNATAQAGLYLGELEQTTILAPPLPEQRRIAEILDTIDEAIRTTEQVIAKLKQMKQGLLHDLLTRGIDDNGDLRDPDRHPEQFKDSPLGRIPRAWVNGRLGDHARLATSGSRGWAAYYHDTGPLFLRIGNLTREHINLRLDSTVHVRPPSNTEGLRTCVQPRDLLISITADLGVIGVVPETMGEAYVNQHIALVRLDEPKADARWVGHYLAAFPGWRQFRSLDDVGAKSGLNLPTVERLSIAIPSTSEQREITRILDNLDDAIQLEGERREKLNSLKRGLMDDLLTGRVRVTVPEDAA